MTLAPAPQEFRRLHLPGHVLLEDSESGFFFVAVGQQPGGSQREPPSTAWSWHSHEDRAEGIEGEVSLSRDALGMEGVEVGVWSLYSLLTFFPSGPDSQPPSPWLPRGF